MSLSKYSKRRGQFEALEAKQLFAADLVGGAAADLADTAVVAGFDHGDLVAEFSPGDLSSVEMNPGDFVHIPAHVRHRVEWTDPHGQTVWLALHYTADDNADGCAGIT